MEGMREHREVQVIAKTVLAELGPTIAPADTERSIAERATAMLVSRGIAETWYYNCPALVLLGSRSCLSISGREYVPADEAVGVTNLITVDLSPMRKGIWGDCARSFYIEGGAWSATPRCREFSRGACVEAELHKGMQRFVTPRTSFAELFQFANAEIKRLGFENLDFLGNVGHSVESTRDARRYVEQGNEQLLGDARLFTFEPHVRQRGSKWGFKHENVYFFAGDGRVVEL